MGWLEVLAVVIALALIGWCSRTEYRWRVASLGRRASNRQDDGGGV